MKKLIYTGIRSIIELNEMRGQVIHLPLLKIEKKSTFLEVDFSLGDWLFFTSVFGIETFFGEEGYLKTLGFSYGMEGAKFWVEKANVKSYLKIGLIGGQTKEALENFGINCHFISKVSQGEEMARQWGLSYPKEKVLLVTASHASKRIEDILGTERVGRLEIYEALFMEENIRAVKDLVKDKEVQAVLLTSSLGVEALVDKEDKAYLDKVDLFAIGKTTLSRLNDYGLNGEILSPKTEVKAHIVAWCQKGEK